MCVHNIKHAASCTLLESCPVACSCSLLEKNGRASRPSLCRAGSTAGSAAGAGQGTGGCWGIACSLQRSRHDNIHTHKTNLAISIQMTLSLLNSQTLLALRLPAAACRTCIPPLSMLLLLPLLAHRYSSSASAAVTKRSVLCLSYAVA
jgi:hypothetical protein